MTAGVETDSSPSALTASVRARALELGFDQVGFARAASADPEGRLRGWLDRGFGGSLAYMARTAAERADPRRLLEGAKSVVALAISYYHPEGRPSDSLKISRYAMGDDYHTVLRRKIRKLRKFILTLSPGARVHPAVDTSPVLERAWAERAGIAWIGKSTMAISTEAGTYTFLAALVTTIEFVYDEPHPDRCGTCTACLDACPTHAFVGPHQLDATRCITYWNIEQRDAFEGAPPPFHGWIAGCDICQEVCPWNKFARTTREPRFRPRPSLVDPDPSSFAADGDLGELGRLLRGTALQRTGAPAIHRNALKVLSERGSRTDAPSAYVAR